MARVTVEDCLDKIPNRFELVVLAARRARDITLGRAPFVEEENDKPTVIALREIAEGKIDLDYLRSREVGPVGMLDEGATDVGREAGAAMPFPALRPDDADDEGGEDEDVREASEPDEAADFDEDDPDEAALEGGDLNADPLVDDESGEGYDPPFPAGE